MVLFIAVCLYLHGAAPLKQISNLWNGILGAIETEGP